MEFTELEKDLLKISLLESIDGLNASKEDKSRYLVGVLNTAIRARRDLIKKIEDL